MPQTPRIKYDLLPKIVQIESPLASDNPVGLQRNITYVNHALRDSLLRGEAPFASHALYARAGVLDDTIPYERSRGMNAGFAFLRVASSMAVYTDLGISPGMREGIALAERVGLPIEYRSLY